MAHTLYWFEGFETGEFSPSALLYSYNNATLSIESTIVSFSYKSLKLVANNSAPYIMFNCDGLDSSGVWVDNNNPIDTTYAWHMYCSALPGSGQVFYIWSGTDAVIWRETAGILEDGKVRLYGEGTPGGTTATSTGAITTGVWYVVSVIVVDHANFQVIIRNRDTGATVVDVSVGNNGHPNRYVRIGCAWAGYGTFYFDNVVAEVSATSVEDPVNLLTTKYAVNQRVPIGAGYYTAGSGSYADVDDFPNDGDTTRYTLAGATAWTMVGSSSGLWPTFCGTVHAVMIKLFEKAAGANSNQAMRLRSGTTDSDSSGARDSDTAYRMEQKIWTLDPATSAAWTVSAMDGAQFGQVWADGTHYTTQISLQVLYSTQQVERIPRIGYFIGMLDGQAHVSDYKSEHIPYDEVRANEWTRYLDLLLPASDTRDDYWLVDDLAYNEGVSYSQDEQGGKVSIASSPDDFVERLVTKIALSSGGSI